MGELRVKIHVNMLPMKPTFTPSLLLQDVSDVVLIELWPCLTARMILTASRNFLTLTTLGPVMPSPSTSLTYVQPRSLFV